MDKVLAPFIFIYHVIHKIISVPAKVFNKTEDKVLEAKDKQELKRAEANAAVPNNNIDYTQAQPPVDNPLPQIKFFKDLDKDANNKIDEKEFGKLVQTMIKNKTK